MVTRTSPASAAARNDGRRNDAAGGSAGAGGGASARPCLTHRSGLPKDRAHLHARDSPIPPRVAPRSRAAPPAVAPGSRGVNVESPLGGGGMLAGRAARVGDPALIATASVGKHDPRAVCPVPAGRRRGDRANLRGRRTGPPPLARELTRHCAGHGGNPQSGPSSDPSSGPASVPPSGHHRSPQDRSNAQVGRPEGSSVYWSDSIRYACLHAPVPSYIQLHLSEEVLRSSDGLAGSLSRISPLVRMFY
jgi:hypothetical protein